MKAVVYSQAGGPEVLRLVERPVPQPGPGEVRVAMRVSGVNPTDWKTRRGGSGRELAFPELVPNQDGAGTVDAVGAGVDASRVEERVWLWEAAWQRAHGTAQEYVALPEGQAVRLDEGVSFDVGASLGIPALTAHRCLTVSELGPRRLTPGALAAQTAASLRTASTSSSRSHLPRTPPSTRPCWRRTAPSPSTPATASSSCRSAS